MRPADVVSLLLRLAMFGALVVFANRAFDRLVGPVFG